MITTIGDSGRMTQHHLNSSFQWTEGKGKGFPYGFHTGIQFESNFKHLQTPNFTVSFSFKTDSVKFFYIYQQIREYQHYLFTIKYHYNAGLMDSSGQVWRKGAPAWKQSHNYFTNYHLISYSAVNFLSTTYPWVHSICFTCARSQMSNSPTESALI